MDFSGVNHISTARQLLSHRPVSTVAKSLTIINNESDYEVVGGECRGMLPDLAYILQYSVDR